MRIPSVATPEFWQLYQRLPLAMRTLARKNCHLWKANAFHPSLRFKRIGSSVFVWQWIGTHEEFNKRFG